MPTFEIDDQFAFHQKTVMAGNEAIGVFARAGAWCAGYLTDGFVPYKIAWTISGESCPPMCPQGTPPGTPQGSPSGHAGDIAGTLPGTSPWTRLIAAGLVVCTETGFQLHDYLHWNRPASSILNDRRRAAEKKRDQRAKMRADSKCPPGTSPGTSKGTTGGRPLACPPPVPASPAPAPSQDLSNERSISETPKPKPGRKPREHTSLADWKPSDAHRSQAHELGVNVDTEAVKFLDYHAAKGDEGKIKNIDAAFRNWLRNAAEYSKRGASLPFDRKRPVVQTGGWEMDEAENERKLKELGIQ